VRATGHPDAAALAQAVAEFAASGAPRGIDQVAQLKVSLAGFRPPIWRRVRLPVTATLADLHEVIQVLFGWDGDHLHLFQVGKKRYGDPFVDLEGTGDEDAVRVRDAVPPGGCSRSLKMSMWTTLTVSTKNQDIPGVRLAVDAHGGGLVRMVAPCWSA